MRIITAVVFAAAAAVTVAVAVGGDAIYSRLLCLSIKMIANAFECSAL